VAFTNGKDILRINGARGTKLDPVAASPQDEQDPTWSADGTRVAYAADGRVLLEDLTKKDAPAIPLSSADDKFENLAWAPTADANLLAMGKDLGNGDTDLCLGVITKDPLAVSCFDEPSFAVIRAIHWSPDGRQILGVGVKAPAGSGIFGIVRWKVKKDKPAFSPDPADWSRGHFVTDTGTPGKGVLDAAISPDGESLALVSNQGSSFFRLWLAKKGDFLMTSAKPTPARACKVAWRGDGQEVMVVQADAGCTEDVGALVRFNVTDVKSQRELNAAGDDPQFQPFNLGG
jgi:dipeptidyl aminopeptidase/acylaminoacyl peptidase